MSAVDSEVRPPGIPERRRHESPDIIDVDAFEADDIVYVGSARPSQRRRVGEDGRAVPVVREVIDVTDSEDENEIQFVGHNPALPRPLVRRERIFSPPPPLQIDGVPPVPQIPERYLALRPLPPGPIIPNEDPLPFEAELRPSAEQPIPIAAAPSHHVPSMGFGGALLAGVRRIMGPRNPSRRSEPRSSWGVSGSFIMRWDPFEFTGEEDGLSGGLDEIGFLDEDDHPFAARRVRSQIERVFKQRDYNHQAEPDYRPEYTHPNQPSPGFTHDFLPSSPSSAVSEDNPSLSPRASGSGSRSCEATLVCASCRDPLVLGAFDVGEDRAKRKLWGLRCGHLLDGKCIEKLMEPAPPPPDTAGPSTMKMATPPAEYPSSSHDTMVVESDAGLMRSRLRPRRGIPVPFPWASYPAPATSSSSRRGASTRASASHRSNCKGKGKMKAPIVEAEHEWSCPVSACGHVHLSLLMGGRWTMDEKRGAIAVFV